ncbi:hypothetical protein GCM10009533_62170 [Saccharopolyspora spinosporotrichia]|uniref:Uncharacterized protein n=1 Tax=Saccharopolyspora erythraea TaxID=1836 RepID=A0ABN1DZ67_SACER|nr:hypothetical protein N599_30420 [Saccharopolyspora erythraea D]
MTGQGGEITVGTGRGRPQNQITSSFTAPFSSPSRSPEGRLRYRAAYEVERVPRSVERR